jgi:thiol-disulfide isomerase/thioredoxin
MVNANKRATKTFHLAAIVAAFAAVTIQLPAHVFTGSYFPPLDAMGLSGGKVPETKGQVVLVDFWASWCSPCKASFPVYSRLQEAYGGRGLTIVAVSVDDNPSAYRAFVDKLKPAFTALYDQHKNLVGLVQVPTMPTSYLLDRRGRVRFVHPGFHGSQTEREVRMEIENLLDEKPGTQ